MKKTKQEVHEQQDNVYKLKKEIRELQDTISSMKKQLKKEQRREEQKSKKTHKTNTTQQQKAVEKKQESSCPKCNEGKLKIVDIAVKLLQMCDSCNFRKTMKHG
jgi:predicted  nucleic acid-binding Zn ribbon protein